MNFNEYQSNALRTAKNFDSLGANLTHAALGIATEGGEFTTEVKRIAIYGKPMTVEMQQHMAEELGDLLWYIALAAEHLHISLHQIARENIAKLQKRFPEKYTDQMAEARLDKGGVAARDEVLSDAAAYVPTGSVPRV